MSKLLRILGIIFIVALVPSFGFCENYLVNGGQKSRIDYRMTQEVQPAKNTKSLTLSYVKPVNYRSPTYSQQIETFNLDFSYPPSKQNEFEDDSGNSVIQAAWDSPTHPLTVTIQISALNQVKLENIKTIAPFPPSNIPVDIRKYCESTSQVDGKNAAIKAKADELCANAKNEFDAVQKILTYVVDHMRYVLTPESFDAAYALRTGKGNCQNYSHLTAALMRAVNIPVRIVNGVTLKQPYDVKTGKGTLTMRMAQGRHSWIEVWFPDLGWVPFDPAATVLFVSNRFIRVEVGMDNDDTDQDGMIRWSYLRGTSGRPRFEEQIDARLPADHVAFVGEKTAYGPQKLLLAPHVVADFVRIATPPPPLPPKIKENPGRMNFNRRFRFGNLEFPENYNFLDVRGPAVKNPDGSMALKKNFIVETAEYVTTSGKQYAQTFILQKPVKIRTIGLALHHFSSDGQLWVKIFEDNHGTPGHPISTSDFINLHSLPPKIGYTWVDFDFSRNEPLLPPGRYWIALGFTGSPIVNWFFTYGKPVGPEDGTRYRTIFDETWSNSLSFEFNYRVLGLTPSEFNH